jgi:rhodanese-related sulfurtransferase
MKAFPVLRLNGQRIFTGMLLFMLFIAMNFSIVQVDAENYSVTKDWVINNLRNPSTIFVDVRSFTEYIGGHIPKAVNIEWTYCYDYNGSIKPNDELKKIFETAGVTPDKTVVTYCYAGFRAKAVYNTLRTLGYPQVFVYEGSWAEWSSDPKVPIEKTCTLALVSGPKNNTNTEGCASCSEPYSRTYTFVSELVGVNKLLALGSAVLNRNVTRLLAHFIQTGFVPNLLKANVTRVIFEAGHGEFDKKTIVVIPCEPVTPKNENVTRAEIFFVSETEATGAISEEVIEGKTWVTFYWVNQTSGQVEHVTTDPCDYWCVFWCAFSNPEVWAYCTAFCVCAISFPPLCLVPCVLCIIGFGSIAAICTIPCGCWAPPTVKIKIEAWPTTDIYSRSHGLAIDQPLPNDWWNYPGYEFKVTGSAFTYETSVTIDTPGTHYVEYAASGYVPNYAWHAKIYINDVLKAEADVGRYNHLRVYFEV